MNGVPASLSAQRQPQEHSGWDLNTEEFILQLKFLFQSQRCFPRYIEHNHAVSQDLFFLHCFWNPNTAAQASFLTIPQNASCYAEGELVTIHPRHPLLAATQGKAAFPPETGLTQVGVQRPGAFSLTM